MSKPIIFQLPASKVELVNESKILYSYSQINAQPLFKYGFHHYINQSKDKLVLLKNDDLKGKQFYNVIENFDNNITNYDQSISKVSKKYIGDEFSRDKLELWETLCIFGFEGNLYVNDESYDELIKVFYKTTKLKYKAVDDFKKVDVYININTPEVDIKQEEQAQIPNVLEAICEISEGLNKNGGCIIKLYDTYTEVSIKLLKLLSEMFEESYIYKPFMSYGRESTKYFVGLNYKNNFKNGSKIKDILKDTKTNKLNNIFSNYTIPVDFEFVIKFMNIELGNYGHKMINVLVDYIVKSNYFGDVYHSSFENQKKTTQFWIEKFFISNNYKKSKDELKSLINTGIKENISKMNETFKLII
jgi:hypothetical protein